MNPAILILASLVPVSMNYGQDEVRAREAKTALVERERTREASGGSAAAMIGWSVFVLGLLGAFLYGMKRWAARSPMVGGGGIVEVLARRRLTGSHEVVVVKVGDRVLVLGATSGGLSVLSEIADRGRIAELQVGVQVRSEERVPEAVGF